jgi:hypothetical protein
MNKFYITIFLGLSALVVNAQSPEYLSDLDNLYASVKKLPSYKAQIIKGEKIDEYQKLLDHLKTGQPANAFEHFYKLSQLIVPLKDNCTCLRSQRSKPFRL